MTLGYRFYINCMKLRRPCLSRDDFIIYLDKFEYDVEESECEPFTPLKGLYLKLWYFKFMGDTRSNVELMALSYASNTIFFFSIS